jgi:hypothetical protein
VRSNKYREENNLNIQAFKKKKEKKKKIRVQENTTFI